MMKNRLIARRSTFSNNKRHVRVRKKTNPTTGLMLMQDNALGFSRLKKLQARGARELAPTYATGTSRRPFPGENRNFRARGGRNARKLLILEVNVIVQCQTTSGLQRAAENRSPRPAALPRRRFPRGKLKQGKTYLAFP
jgi:hypothetical protein